MSGFVSHKSRALLAYLAVESDLPQPREKLACLLWPECPDQAARNNLRFTLSSLRKAIGEAGAENPALCVSRQTIQFNPRGDSWVDVRVFIQLLDGQSPRLEHLQAAIELYRGEFLEGFASSDSIAFEEWLLLKREQYHRQALAALFQAAALHAARGEYSLALPYAWRQVALEPWREESHRQLMRLLALDDQRSAALAQFEVCRRALAQELNVEPAHETIRLYQQICNEELEGGGSKPSSAAGISNASEREGIISGKKSRFADSRLYLRSSFRKIGLILGIVLLAMVGLLIVRLAAGGGLGGAGQSDGEPKVALVCEGSSPTQICLGSPTDGQIRPLTGDLEFEWIHEPIAWSPDGEQMVFTAKPAGASHGVYILDVETLHATSLSVSDATSLLVEGNLPAWSPDGTLITFQQEDSLMVMRPDGTELRRLVFQHCPAAVDWSPDSQWIAFLDGSCPSGEPKTLSVYKLRVDGSQLQKLHGFDQPGSGELAWSPDGSQIACFVVFADGQNSWLIDASGDGQAQPISQIPGEWRENYWPRWGEKP